jgi:hypothetical protein
MDDASECVDRRSSLGHASKEFVASTCQITPGSVAFDDCETDDCMTADSIPLVIPSFTTLKLANNNIQQHRVNNIQRKVHETLLVPTRPTIRHYTSLDSISSSL